METAPLEHKLKDSILAELRRQAENSDGALTLAESGDGRVELKGPVDLDDLVMVVAGSVAGGP